MDLSVLDPTAGRQHGLITAAQLSMHGFSPKRIRHLAGRGFLIRATDGVYRVAGAPVTWRQRVMTATLAGGESALASHRCATGVWRCEGARPGVIEIVSDRHFRCQHLDVLAHESRDLPVADRWVVDGIPVTSIERTLIDVGRYLPPAMVGAYLDHAVRAGRTTYERFERRTQELARRGRPGIATARQVLTARGFGDGWGFERAMRTAMREAGLPAPTREHRVRVGKQSYFIDFMYPEALLGIECDSKEWHTLPYQIDSDLARQNDILGEGILLLRYTKALLKEDPRRVTDQIRRHLEQRRGLASLVPAG
ncbi:MAG: hypothetical protein U0Q22_10615 [Acidimicrobiales bacterium]